MAILSVCLSLSEAPKIDAKVIYAAAIIYMLEPNTW